MDVSPTDPQGRYLPWEELRRRSPPKSWTHEQWWALTHFARRMGSVPIPELVQAYGVPARFVLTEQVKQQLHELDRNTSDKLLLEIIDDPEELSIYRMRELLDEAIDSSMIEGAKPTTRESARQMLREGRAAASRDERMIVNNWRAMQWLLERREEDVSLDISDLLELHRIIGEDSLECERPAGEFREHEEITVSDLYGEVWHLAPPREGLEERIAAMLRFAQPEPKDRFVHPVIRAILVHFWLAYEHPFCDGNGRMARALYYWVMLREGYEIAEFLSISGSIRQRGNKYYRAFAYCEAEDLDLTYFLLDQFESIQIALERLVEKLKARKERVKATEELIPELGEINHRQRALLHNAIRHPLRTFTIKGHAAANKVHYMTARSDLADLERRGMLSMQKVKKEKRYRLGEKIRKTTLK
jgi:Fic family protein